MMNLELSEQEVIRRQSLEELRKLGINPYPAAKYEVNTTSAEILSKFDPEKKKRTHKYQGPTDYSEGYYPLDVKLGKEEKESET